MATATLIVKPVPSDEDKRGIISKIRHDLPGSGSVTVEGKKVLVFMGPVKAKQLSTMMNMITPSLQKQFASYKFKVKKVQENEDHFVDGIIDRVVEGGDPHKLLEGDSQ